MSPGHVSGHPRYIPQLSPGTHPASLWLIQPRIPCGVNGGIFSAVTLGIFLRECCTPQMLRNCMLSDFIISFRGLCSQSANDVLGFQKHKALRQEEKAPFAEGYKLALANSFFFSFIQSSYTTIILGWSGARWHKKCIYCPKKVDKPEEWYHDSK